MFHLYKSLSWQVRVFIIIGIITLLCTSLVLVATASVGTGPVLENFTPTNGTTLTVANPKISFTASDPDQINGSSVQVKVNGKSFTATVRYAEIGHWEKQYDSCGQYEYDVWVVDGYDYTKATIEASTSNLPDYSNVWVSVADKLGNTSTGEWAFNCMVAPVIGNLTPAKDAAITNPQPTISAKVTDNGTIDAQSIILKVGTTVVSHSFDSATGVVSYNPPQPLPEGVNNVYLEVRDTAGNKGVMSWSFRLSLDLTGPTLENFSPAPGSSLTTSGPTISFTASDPDTINASSVQVKVNGKSFPVIVEFQKKGHWEDQYDSCSGQIIKVWVDDGYDYTNAFVTSKASNVPDNANIWVSVADIFGNTKTAEWTISCLVPPIISNLNPANGSSANSSMPTISAKVTDNGTIDTQSIILKLGTDVLKHSFEQATGTVSYNVPAPLDKGIYSVYLEVKDTAGLKSSASWSFGVEQGATGFASETPAAGLTVNIVNPQVKVDVSDTVNLDSKTVTMRLNGNKVTPNFSYYSIGHWETYEDSCSGGTYEVWVIDGYDYKRGTISYKPATLPDGTNTVAVSIANSSGTPSSYTWSFTAKVPPKISNASPANNSIITSQTPVISAKATDNGTIADVKMLVDGVEVAAFFDAATGMVSYIPPSNLQNGEDHTVQLTVTDGVGESATLTWKFHVQIYPDMPVTITCADCHQGYPVPKHPMNNCDACHGGSQPIEDCRGCHGDWQHGPDLLVSAWDHGGRWQPKCEDCHNTAYSYKVPTHSADSSSYHITTTNFEACKACHERSLTREHYRHTDSAGNKYTCGTCHITTNTQVQQAIANKQKNCDACHIVGSDGHGPVHDTTNLDSKCTTCHNNNLYNEHVENTATQTKALSCGTCHDATLATNPLVYGAISTDNKQCAACHRQGHNVYLAETVPSDIPLYSGFIWSIPDDARLWAGESWMPDEFLVGGKVIISNRRPDVTGDAVWNFYNTEMTANGWTLASAVPAAGSNFYSVTFTKGTHKAIIWFYGGEAHTASPVLASGYRVEILYK